MNDVMYDYPVLINSILKYIKYVKDKEKNINLLEIIMDYSIKNNIELEYIGDAISTDNHFKTLFQKDLELYKYFKTEKSEEW